MINDGIIEVKIIGGDLEAATVKAKQALAVLGYPFATLEKSRQAPQGDWILIFRLKGLA